MPDPPRVFISYSHEPDNDQRVLGLADRLRRDGVDARLDRYELAPAKGWQLWMEDEIEAADFVLVVATQIYEQRRRGKAEPGEGRGVRREGMILSQEIYDQLENHRCVPIVFRREDEAHIPVFLKAFDWYDVGTDDGYDDLYRRLTAQPEVDAPPVGTRREMPQREARWTREPTRAG